MKRTTILIAALVLAACEGEPPKVPQGATPNVPAPAAETTATAEPAAAPASSACNCACACSATDGGATLAAISDGGAAAPAAAPVATPIAAHANVVGHVTTMPVGAAANAVVFFEDGPADPPSEKAPLIDNHMMNFLPFVQVAQADGRVIFRNSDPFPHNVFSPDGKGFNVGIIAQHATATRVFKTPGEYSLLCNLHPGMLGYLVVTPNGHFARTNAAGQYAIKDVPPGTYKVTAWAPRQKPVTQSVTVAGGSDVTLDFEIHR